MRAGAILSTNPLLYSDNANNTFEFDMGKTLKTIKVKAQKVATSKPFHAVSLSTLGLSGIAAVATGVALTTLFATPFASTLIIVGGAVAGIALVLTGVALAVHRSKPKAPSSKEKTLDPKLRDSAEFKVKAEHTIGDVERMAAEAHRACDELGINYEDRPIELLMRELED